MSESTQHGDGEHLSPGIIKRFHKGDLPFEAFLAADEHLFSCPQCMADLDFLVQHSATAQTAVTALTQAFEREHIELPLSLAEEHTNEFPSFETIAAYVDGTLPSPEVTKFKVALTRFTGLAEQVEDLHNLREKLDQPRTALKGRKTLFGKSSSPLFKSRVKSDPKTSSPSEQTYPFHKAQGRASFGSVPSIDEQPILVPKRTPQLIRFASPLLCALIMCALLWNMRQQLSYNREQSKSGQKGTPTPVPTPTPDLPPSTFIPGRKPRPDAVESLPLLPFQQLLTLSDPKQNSTISHPDDQYQTMRDFYSHDQSPAGTKIRTLQPVLRWTPTMGHRYTITLLDETTKVPVFEDRPENSGHLKVEDTLIPGHSYLWTLELDFVEGSHQNRQRDYARFQILSEAEELLLQQKLTKAHSSESEKIIALAEMGLNEEAFNRLDALHKSHNKSRVTPNKAE